MLEYVYSSNFEVLLMTQHKPNPKEAQKNSILETKYLLEKGTLFHKIFLDIDASSILS